MVFRGSEGTGQEEFVGRVCPYGPVPIPGQDFRTVGLRQQPQSVSIRTQPHGRIARQRNPARIGHRPAYWMWFLGNGLVEPVAQFKVQVLPGADVEIDFEWVIPCALKDMLQLQIHSGVVRGALGLAIPPVRAALPGVVANTRKDIPYLRGIETFVNKWRLYTNCSAGPSRRQFGPAMLEAGFLAGEMARSGWKRRAEYASMRTTRFFMSRSDRTEAKQLPLWPGSFPLVMTSLMLGASGSLLILCAGETAEAAEKPTVNIVQAPAQCLVPDVVIDAQGILHLVYGLEHHACYVRSADNGKTFTPPLKVNSTGMVETKMGERGPKLAVGSDGSIHVVWVDASPCARL